MAKSEQAASERAERELQSDINSAIAGTESEVFTDAMGDDALDNDGDRSLEEMGDGLEGDELDEDESAGKQASAKGEEGAEKEEGDDDDGDDDPEEQPRDDRGRFQEQRADDRREQRIPPAALREERERRQSAETRERALADQVKALSDRLDSTLTQIATARPTAQPVAERPAERKVEKPDMFADPDGYENWVLNEAEKKADARFEQRFKEFDQRQQERSLQRVDESFAEAAQGPRGWEFQAAYGKLRGLDPKDTKNRQTVFRILQHPDPTEQLFTWWEENGGPEYREQIAEQLGFQPPPRRGGREEQRQAPPRHEVRLPGSFRRGPPSLNSAAGNGRQPQNVDPDASDGSEDSVFRFAMK